MDKKYIIDEYFIIYEDVDERLDVYISGKYKQFTRSFIKNLIERGNILLNGAITKPGVKIKKGHSVRVTVPRPKTISAEPQDIPIDIVYQDEHIAVINKQKGMVTHPAAGNHENTLVNALLFHIKDLSGINGNIRPGIVHRLDKDTSGLIVVAKNDEAHKKLAKQIKDKTAQRVYLAIVHGNIKDCEGVIDAPIGRHRTNRKLMAVTENGKPAVTHYKVLERFGDYTYLEARLATGRTHQIRVHFKHIGHPVAGDAVYGPKKSMFGKKGQLLHAYRLSITHPATGAEMNFEAPPPGEFQKILDNLRNKAYAGLI